MVKITLEKSGEQSKLHSKRVENNQNYTRNEWRTWKKKHSKRAEYTLYKYINKTAQLEIDWNCLERNLLHSKRVYFRIFSTRNECRFFTNRTCARSERAWHFAWPMPPSAERHGPRPAEPTWKLHSKRVRKMSNYTKNEWGRSKRLDC